MPPNQCLKKCASRNSARAYKVLSNLKIDRLTVTKILKQADEFNQLKNDEQAEKTFRHRSVKHLKLELAMNVWIEQVTIHGIIISDSLIKKKSHQFAKEFGIPEESFTFSNGWVTKFKKRNGLRKIIMHSEAASAPLENLPTERTKLRELLSQYNPDDIYNADETGLFYRLLLNQMISKKAIAGKKKDKSRITILLCANSTGSDKFRSLVIGSSKKPRSFNGINRSQLPANYRNNEKAWMRCDIWENWLKFIDDGFRIQNRKVLLLVDNAPSHMLSKKSNTNDTEDTEEPEEPKEPEESEGPEGPEEPEEPKEPKNSEEPEESEELGEQFQERPQERSQGRSQGKFREESQRKVPDYSYLTNITVHFLPPNMTAHLQPMDAGIVKCFKSKYKNLYCRHLLSQFEKNEEQG
ncbi:3925_t:CDS:2 [Gigaspora rosea]|nr:3925_t:CDS:2 [Gigaspora rosea]